MKKISIFMVAMVILLGMLNATPVETHSIMIRTTVDEVLPAFRLVYEDFHTNEDTTLFDTGQDVVADSGYNLIPNSIDTGKDIGNEDISVTFHCYVTPKEGSYIKTQRDFRIGFSATPLANKDGKVNRNGIPTDSTIPVESSSIEMINTSFSSDEILMKDGVIADFKGKKIQNKSGNIASYTVKYGKDITVDPDTYYSTITMTVTME